MPNPMWYRFGPIGHHHTQMIQEGRKNMDDQALTNLRKDMQDDTERALDFMHELIIDCQCGLSLTRWQKSLLEQAKTVAFLADEESVNTNKE